MLEKLIELKKSNAIFIDIPIRNIRRIKNFKLADCNCDCRTACDCSDCNDCNCDCDCNCNCDCDCSVDCNCDDDTSW